MLQAAVGGAAFVTRLTACRPMCSRRSRTVGCRNHATAADAGGSAADGLPTAAAIVGGVGAACVAALAVALFLWNRRRADAPRGKIAPSAVGAKVAAASGGFTATSPLHGQQQQPTQHTHTKPPLASEAPRQAPLTAPAPAAPPAGARLHPLFISARWRGGEGGRRHTSTRAALSHVRATSLPPGWSREGPDKDGDVWFEHADGRQQWDAPTL